ncbi:MAG: hypothetical protein FWC68_06270, partial [Oscillospiraceae bacterium]|nr:hypothetical protein [Oscillospiraceae bacterium]
SSIGTAVALRIEDIERNMADGQLAQVQALTPSGQIPFGQQPTSGFAMAQSWHPTIWGREIGSSINNLSVRTSGLGRSEQYMHPEPFLLGQTQSNTIRPTRTNWSSSIATRMRDPIYVNMLTYMQPQWLASRTVSATESIATFNVMEILSTTVQARALTDSGNTQTWGYGRRVRPIVTLNTDVVVTGGDATDGWNIQ